MNFTTPAFVRVENPQERKELIEWLVGIGYDSEKDDPLTTIILVRCSTTGNRNRTYLLADFALPSSQSMAAAHDCGTNIPLFKALAAMNDKNDLYQYFVDKELGTDGNWLKSYNENGDAEVMNLRKATAEEIINHFKN